MYRSLAYASLANLVLCLPLMAAPSFFTAFLDGPSESPPNASPGTGTALVTIDPVAHTLRVQTSFSGLLANVTVAHIHVINGPGDANTSDTVGPVATVTPTFTGFPSGVTAGSYDRTFDMTLTTSYNPSWITNSGGTTALGESFLFAGINDGRAYLNIHSSLFPGGEIRGFLTPIPEVPSGLLVAVGLVGVALVRRRIPKLV